MVFSDSLGSESQFDAVLIGAGIMSSTLAALLHELDPEMRTMARSMLGDNFQKSGLRIYWTPINRCPEGDGSLGNYMVFCDIDHKGLYERYST